MNNSDVSGCADCAERVKSSSFTEDPIYYVDDIFRSHQSDFETCKLVEGHFGYGENLRPVSKLTWTKIMKY